MAEHRIKIQQDFADAVLSGDKNFEVRKNDRGYQKDDTVIFQVVDRELRSPIDHPLNKTPYWITYVISGWGIENGYVVFGIRPKPRQVSEKIEEIDADLADGHVNALWRQMIHEYSEIMPIRSMTDGKNSEQFNERKEIKNNEQ